MNRPRGEALRRTAPIRARARHRVALACLGALAGVAACTRGVPAPPGDFASASAAFLAGTARERPVWATEVGLHDRDGRLDDLSAEAIAGYATWLRGQRGRFERFDPSGLSLDDRVDREVVLTHIDSDLFDLETLRCWRTDPHLYTQLAGRSVHPLLEREHAPLPARLDSICSRLEQWPRLFVQARANLAGPPRPHTEAALRQCESLLLWLDEDLRQALPESEVTPALGARLGAASETARAAVEEFHDFLAESLLPRADGDFRLGRARFETALRLRLRTQQTSREIRDCADAECARIRREMYDLALPAWRALHPGTSPPGPAGEGIDAVVRPALERIAADTVPAGDLLDVCRGAVDSLRQFCAATDLVGLDPEAVLRVEWMPPFARGLAVAGLDPPGVLDRDLPVRFQVQPVASDWTEEQVASFLREYNRPMLHALAMHEALPGHFLQLCRARRSPRILRNVFPNEAFVEGWAVYAEGLAIDAGYGAGDARLALAQRKLQLRSVLNARLDVGVHCDGMSEEDGIALLMRAGFQEEAEARGKWLRAVLDPAGLSTYFVGWQEIRALEVEDRERTGAGWSRRDFLDRLLSHGSPAVSDLRLLLRAPHGGSAVAPAGEGTR